MTVRHRYVDDTDGTLTVNGNAIGGGSSHALLSATHSDALAASVVRGALVYGNSTPKWALLAVPGALSGLSHDGTDVSWVTANGTGNPARTTNVVLVTPTLGVFTGTSGTVSPGNDATGLTVTGGSITGSGTTPFVSVTGTWNTSGVVTGFKVNITNSASSGSSLLQDWQVGSSTVARLRVDGIFFGGGFRDTTSGNSFNVNGLSLANLSATFSWSNSLFLTRDADNVHHWRNSTNAQEARFAETWTDASNYERGVIRMGSDAMTLAWESAGTGASNGDIVFTPKGTGVVKFGTYASLGSEVLAGYITIKDAAGNSRKLAVIA